MKKPVQKPLSEWKVTHILADGTVRDSMEGFKVPYNENTAIAYDILSSWVRKKANSEESLKKNTNSLKPKEEKGSVK